MRERPILFNGAMVRAILAGQKTQTRRAVKSIPWRDGSNPGFSPASAFSNAGEFRIAGSEEITTGFRCPFGQVGDRLWVRETWMDLAGTGIEHRDPVSRRWMRYAYGAQSPKGSASDEARKDFGLKWRPSIHMPRAACRLVLEITAVRVERLKAISEPDALAEGIEELNGRYTHNGGSCECRTPTGAFVQLWESTGGDWDSNPWVWVIEFKRVEVQP